MAIDMKWEGLKARGFLGVDVREAKGLTPEQLAALNVRSANGERESVRAQLVSMGAVIVADMDAISPLQGVKIRRVVKVDVRSISPTLTRAEAQQFLTRAIDGNEVVAVRKELVERGAVDHS